MGDIYENVMFLLGQDIFGQTDITLSQDDLRLRYYQIGERIGLIIIAIFGRTGGYEYPKVTINYPIEFDIDFV